MQKILKWIRKADDDFNLIENGDHILIGVSGGKDSMLLAKSLHIYQQFKHKNFTLTAVHMKMGFPNEDSTKIKQFMNDLSVPYYEEDVPIYPILLHYLKTDHTLDCSRCSSLKRGAIVNIAKVLKANKIAFAHHGDDAVETFFMNAIYTGKRESFQPKIIYEDNKVTFIRPLIYVHEEDVIKTVKKESITIVSSQCPKDKVSKREDIKQLLHQIYQQFPSSKHNLLNMLSDDQAIYWKKEKKND